MKHYAGCLTKIYRQKTSFTLRLQKQRGKVRINVALRRIHVTIFTVETQ